MPGVPPIVVTVVGVRRGCAARGRKVRLGFAADPSVTVHRAEVDAAVELSKKETA